MTLRRMIPRRMTPRRMTPRRTRLLLLSAMSMLVGLGLATVPLVSGGGTRRLQAPTAGVAVVLLVATLTVWPGGLGWTVGAFSTVYAAGLVRHPRSVIDPTAPLEAAALLLLAELVAWSLECRSVALDAAAVVRWRLRRLAVLVAASLAGGWVLVAASDLPSYGGTAMAAIGMASTVALLGLAAWAPRTRPGRRQSRA